MHNIEAILGERATSLSRDIAGQTGLNPAKSRDLLNQAAVSLGAHIRAGRVQASDPNSAFQHLDTQELARTFGIKPKQVEAGLRAIWPRLCSALASADVGDNVSGDAVVRGTNMGSSDVSGYSPQKPGKGPKRPH